VHRKARHRGRCKPICRACHAFLLRNVVGEEGIEFEYEFPRLTFIVSVILVILALLVHYAHV